ncbi:MAG: polysaccharide biosynthesis C-terminal domain-containing protein, partial [Ruminococcus sp.]
GGIRASLKGWCNAVCRVKLTAFCDAAEFIVRIAVLAGYIIKTDADDTKSLCVALALSMAAGTAVSLFVLMMDFLTHRMKSAFKTTISFSGYIRLALPVIFSGCLTSALSTANDALIPVTLRQSGSTAEAALAQFGIFEAVVIPVLFFPTAVLCVLSGILIPEAARARTGEKTERLRYLTRRSVKFTMCFSLFVSAALLMFGKNIALILHEEPLAGKMLMLLAPVVPFIYLEIILEAIIKGTGKQQFSMLNYLAEYAVRISVVLIFIPIMGFYGIVASYYASNVFGNCMRFIKVCKITGLSPDWKEMLIYPLLGTAAAFYLPHTALRCFGIEPSCSALWTVSELFLSAAVYIFIMVMLKDSYHNIRKRKFDSTAEAVK